jgi:hypothetical protein
LFDTFLAHLQKEHGLALAKEGVMVDASFAEVPWQRNSSQDRVKVDGWDKLILKAVITPATRAGSQGMS